MNAGPLLRADLRSSIAQRLLVVASAVIPFLPVLKNGFVNFDDPAAIVNNPRLVEPGTLRWAFATTMLGHYQPVAWLCWSALKRTFGASAPWFHGASLLVHAVNALLVYTLTRRIASINAFEPRKAGAIAAIAAMMFAVHPLAVEPVAWASAFPYLVSLSLLILSFLAYLRYRQEERSRQQMFWFGAACVGYAAALLTRASVVAFPLVLLSADLWILNRSRGATGIRRVVAEKLPFAALALASGLIEAHAREFATVAEVSVTARASMVLSAPLIYLRHALIPTNLSPLDVLPIAEPVVWPRLALAAAGLVILLSTAWIGRSRWPAATCGGLAFLLLIGPVSGWAPSGLQATADRYMYIPGVPLAMLVAFAMARAFSVRRDVTGICLTTMLLTLAVLSWRQTYIWHDSISLWTRAATLNPRNDVATYNLGVALGDAGREDEAIARYEETLVLVPDHALARRNRDILVANRAEHEAAELASLNRFQDAIARYEEALQLDPTRVHARAGRGIALSRLQRWSEAAGDLETVFYQGVSDSEVANSLARVLTHLDRYGDAILVLKLAIARHHDDITLAHHLARLLTTAPTPDLRDAPLAVRLAQEVCARTDNRDPRALDTLSAAYAANGQLDLARAIALRGRAIAHSGGDQEIAALLDARVRSFQK